MTTSEAGLQFPPDTSRGGFETSRTSDLKSNAEPIVRELIQNSLDAGATHIEFKMETVQWSDVPDLNKYRETLDKAKETASTAADGTMRAADDSIVKRIERCLERPDVRLMWCFDNGSGLDWQRMFRLLEEGAGSKGADAESRGSFGLGHLQPFGASDMRYVLYGGSIDLSSELLCSGQAILAVHQREDDTFCSGTGVLAKELDTSNKMFERRHEYGRVPVVEDRLGSWLANGNWNSGTAVGLLGFNSFGNSDHDSFINAVFDAAAKHFSVAIIKSSIKITIAMEDDISRELSAQNSRTIDRRKEVWTKETTRSKARGRLLPGRYAHRIYDTLGSGTESEAAGCDIWIRRLSERDQPTKVNIFRDGMWITYAAPGLEPRVFNDTNTFDAIVDITGRSELYKLAKTAEPYTHLEIDRRRLDPDQRVAYDRCVDEIASRLKEIAGEASSDHEYEDPTFAPVEGIEAKLRRAQPLNPTPPPSPTPEPGPEQGPGPEPGPPGPLGPEPPEPRPPEPRPPEPGPRDERPNPSGKPTGRVISTVAQGGAAVSAMMTQEPDSDMVAVTLIRHSGSDRSCDRFVHPRYIPIRSVITNVGNRFDAEAEHPLEIRLPLSELQIGPFKVLPVDTIVENHGVEIVLRRRKVELAT